LRTHDATNNWHLRLFNKSIIKRDKLKAIVGFLPPTAGMTCLDLGGDNGIISWFLRQHGGTWHSADLDERTVEAIRALVESNVHRTDGVSLPFPARALDLVVIIDLLEHLSDDHGFIRELHRVIKERGILIINVPHVKKRTPLRRLRNALGLTDEKHGHRRPGYTARSIRELLEGKFEIVRERTYSGFFTELLDVAINTAFPGTGSTAGVKGRVVTEKDLKRNRIKFRIYSALYPFMWLFSRLDTLFPFIRGHRLIIQAIKPAEPAVRRG
jgi:SAM-dependent methyltransferase